MKRRVMLLASLCLASLVPAQSLTVVGYNTESGGAAPDVVAERIAEIDGCDIWGCSEVQNEEWAAAFEAAAEDGEHADFECILGTTGGGDRLAIIYDADRLELLGTAELHDINPQQRVRSPLVATFRVQGTNKQFLFMVNHLYRSRAEKRLQQAEQLRAWAATQDLPVVAVGDYNFDWDVVDGDTDHDAGYDALCQDGVWEWVRPADLVKTNHSGSFNSVLDFVFVAGPARCWTVASDIIVAAGDFPDDHTTSDHRPVRATFDLAGAVPTELSEAELEDLRARLRTAIQQLEAEVSRLRAILEDLGGHP